MSGAFTFRENKHPGACAYCTRRVAKAAGTIWQDAGAWLVAHTECLSKAHAEGRAPDVADPSSTSTARLKAAREIMRTVRMDAPQDSLDAAWAQLVALVHGEAVPF